MKSRTDRSGETLDMLAATKSKAYVIGATALAGMLAIGGVASSSALTLSDSSVDGPFGAKDVQTLHIADIDYTLHPTDKSKVSSATFHVAPFNSRGDDVTAYFRPNSKAATAWLSCGSAAKSTTLIECDFASGTEPDVVSFGEADGSPSNMQLLVAG